MKVSKKIMALGLAGLITALTACSKGEPTAELTSNNYYQAAVIELRTHDFAEKTGESTKKLLIYDLDGKKDSMGELTADEVFEIPGGEGIWDYRIIKLNYLPFSKWKHYLASDADKPLVSNNITPMSDIQRADYNAFLSHSTDR